MRLPDFPPKEMFKCYLVLGAFLDNWSGLERSCINLLQKILGSDYETAAAIFYNTSGPHQYGELFSALSEARCTPKQRSAISAVIGRIKKFSKKRNAIVHGEWIVHSLYDLKTGKSEIEPRLCRNSQSMEERQRIAEDDALRNKDWFLREDIRSTIDHINILQSDIEKLITSQWGLPR